MGLVCRCKCVDCMTRSYKLVYRRFREDDASKGGVGSHWMKIEARVLFNLQAFLLTFIIALFFLGGGGLWA